MQLASSRHQAKVKKRRDANDGKKKKTSAWKELLQGLALYAFCISLPGIIGFLLYLYDTYVVSFANDHMRYLPPWLRGEEENDSMGAYNNGDSSGVENKEGYDLSSSSSYMLPPFLDIGQCYDTASNYICTSSILSPQNSQWCKTLTSSIKTIQTSKTMNEQLGIIDGLISDVQVLISLSILLALMRVALVHMLVPRYLAPRRLAAFMRCKSTHLLSSSAYQFSPVMQGKSLKKMSPMMRLSSLDGAGASAIRAGATGLAEGTSGADGGQNLFVGDGDGSTNPRRGWVSSTIRRMLDFMYSVWCNFRSAFRRATGHEPAAPYESLDATAALRLFSAPKYATAVFRLIYCAVSCTTAFVLFRSADFWPIYVGGKATSSTKNCWDLSGTIALGSLDSDFDHRNVALRFFFIAQASYQVHSLFFHIVSMVLLLLYGGKKDGGALVSMKSSTKSYLRPLVEHFITIWLIFGAYIFSGLRRLGAVGIFTLEFSSVFLQVLQICINAPETSPLRRPGVVNFVHRYVVMPTFIYCRFIVFPTLWYSAAFESEEWLEQIERAFMPGSALVLYIFFNALLMLIFGLNLVFFRRLLYHPLLKEMTSQKIATHRTS